MKNDKLWQAIFFRESWAEFQDSTGTQVTIEQTSEQSHEETPL